jgi:hypothetical protein
MVRSELPKYFKSLGFKVGVEIGVYKGEFTELFLKEGIFVYAIDPWIAYSEQSRQERQDFLYRHTLRELKKYPNCKILRKSSMEAVNEFDDCSLDFVFIDGDHSFKSIADDISEWEKKVKKGGVVAGHDYSGQSSQYVPYVVDAYAKAFKRELVLFGSPQEKIKRGDKQKSWLWIKL